MAPTRASVLATLMLARNDVDQPVEQRVERDVAGVEAELDEDFLDPEILRGVFDHAVQKPGLTSLFDVQHFRSGSVIGIAQAQKASRQPGAQPAAAPFQAVTNEVWSRKMLMWRLRPFVRGRRFSARSASCGGASGRRRT